MRLELRHRLVQRSKLVLMALMLCLHLLKVLCHKLCLEVRCSKHLVHLKDLIKLRQQFL